MGWRLAYSHDGQGNPLSGSLATLKEAALNGHDVKVMVMDDKRGHSYILKTDCVFVQEDFVCAENTYGAVSVDQDTDKTLKWKDENSKEGKLYNWMVIFCTKGYIEIARPFLGTADWCPGKERREYHTLKWFVDE